MSEVGVVVAGGRGRRLGPLGEVVHKSLLPCRGRPLVDHAIERCVTLGCDEVIVIGHHLLPQLEAYLGSKDRCRPQVRIVDDLGVGSTLGALAMVRAELPAQFVYTHANIVVDPAEFEFCAVDDNRSLLFVSRFDRAPTHPYVRIRSDNSSVAEVHERGAPPAGFERGWRCSIGLARLWMQDLIELNSNGAPDTPMEMALQTSIAEGRVMSHEVERWQHFERLEDFHEVSL